MVNLIVIIAVIIVDFCSLRHKEDSSSLPKRINVLVFNEHIVLALWFLFYCLVGK